MSELENSFPFSEVDEDLDIAAIFGGSSTAAPPPPAPEIVEIPAAEEEPKPEEAQPEAASAPEIGNSDDGTAPDGDLFSALMSPNQSEVPTAIPAAASTKQVSLFDKQPIFSYGGSKEEIKDSSMTFEELRIAKADDFPELAEGKKVSWTVEYGKVSKSITDPKGVTIARVKEEIEQSKAFLDNLKKGKDKNPECLVKPRVTAQSKGIAAYKGAFLSVEAARVSEKTICLLPAEDGRIYELRKTELGEFIAPKNNIVDFPAVRAGFTPALPQIPRELMGQIIAFFRCFMKENTEFEALVHIYWDKKLEEYTVFVPKQTVSKAHIDADLRGDALPEDRYLHYADVHSHNSMSAKFSPVDDADEKATRLYFVIGRLDRFYPEITARFSCGGVYQEIDPALVLEGVGDKFPGPWLDNVTREAFAEEGFKSKLDAGFWGKLGERVTEVAIP